MPQIDASLVPLIAEESDSDVRTVLRFAAGHPVRALARKRILRALASRGIEPGSVPAAAAISASPIGSAR